MQLIEYILQPTAKLKTPLQILFLKKSERKECSKISKIPESICKIDLSHYRCCRPAAQNF